MAEIVLSLARKNDIWASKIFWECSKTDVPRWARVYPVVKFRMLVVARKGHRCCQSPFPRCVTQSLHLAALGEAAIGARVNFISPLNSRQQTCPERCHPPFVCWGHHCWLLLRFIEHKCEELYWGVQNSNQWGNCLS